MQVVFLGSFKMSNAFAFFARSEVLANWGRLNIKQSFQTIFGYVFPTNAPLLKLTAELNDWNARRVSKNHLNDQAPDLSVGDIESIKQTINEAIKRSSTKNSEVFSDQILFLVIGAIQIQAQTDSDKAWQLVNLSIKNTVESTNEKKIYQLSIFLTALIICICSMWISNLKVQEMKNIDSNYSVEKAITGTDPVTISMLELAYNKMKSGTCQLPQAAMLPVEQRNAYLSFINKGVIEVHHVESLRQALGYVNCLYPQELMHPQLPEVK